VPNPNSRIVVTAEQYEKYLKVATIRNPWSRAVSWYHNVIESDYHIQRLKLKADITFREFLIRFAGHGPLRSQLDWLVEFSGEIRLDRIVRYEYIGELVHDVSKTLGVKNIELPHLIRSKRSDYRLKYDSDLYDFVANVYSQEIKEFKFEFDDDKNTQPFLG
jgi:hypothetical protein